MTSQYKFKTKPFDHQFEQFERSKDLEYFGILWEQGTGKTKLVIDNVGYLFEGGKIDGLLVVAPNVIHGNWVTNEIPTHMPDRIMKKILSYTYYSTKVKTQKHKRMLADLHAHRGLSVLSITYDALATAHGKRAAIDFLTKRNCMVAADESTRIKTPRARRTKAALNLTMRALFRRILSGTPVDNSPFDVYSQCRFLHPQFWGSMGVSTFTGFKTKFGVFVKGYNGSTGRQFDQLVNYKSLPRLHEYLMHHCSRVTKDQVLDLPPKLYSRLEFELSPKQAKAYASMANNLCVLLENGSLSTSELVITQLLRLQQIACGYIVDDNGDFHIIDENHSPRIDALKEKCEDLSHQSIIWCKFQKDADLICDALGDRCRRADGTVKASTRLELCNEFQRGGFQTIVSNPAAMGEGMNLFAARSVFYYNNSFKLGHRLQSEDRAHRIGQEHPVNYTDIVASGTVDLDILDSLLRKVDLASKVTGDELKEWIRRAA